MSLPPPMVKYDAFGSDVPLAEPSWCALFSSSFTLRLSFFFVVVVRRRRISVIISVSMRDDVASRS